MKRHIAALLAATMLTSAAAADTLRYAHADNISALDPQLNNYAGDHNAGQTFFATLTPKDVNGPVPFLAESWKLVDPMTWEFKLRDNANWSDGQPVTAEDIKFSYTRALDVPGSVAGFKGFLRTVESVEVTGPKTFLIHTKVPNPMLPTNLSTVYVVSKHGTEGATTDDFNSGKAMITEGAYLYESYVPGEVVTMTRNDGYWGPMPEWENVTYRYIQNPAARTAALLSGDVDVIGKVSLSDVDKLRDAEGVTLWDYPGLRVQLLQPSFKPGPNPFITDNDGNPLEVNPLRNVKVRQALNLAINREAIASRLMRNGVTVADQWMPEGTFGYDTDHGAIAYDPEAAKALLAEAGYPQGFKLTMHAPSEGNPMSVETAQAVAQFWSRIGVMTQVEGVPKSVYNGKAGANEYAMSMIAWGNGTAEGSYAMTYVLATRNKEKGLGAYNWGRYSSAELDALLAKVTSEFDDATREGLIKDAVKVVMGDVGVIPLYHYKLIWASRDDLKVTPWTSDRAVPMQVTKLKE